jgi:general secretion pathway protein A
VRLVAELSRGLPRRINVLCDRTLEEGQVAGASELGPNLVKRAARSIAGTSVQTIEELPPVPEPGSDALSLENLDLSYRPEVVEIPISFGADAAPPARGRVWLFVGVGMLALAAAVAFTGYAWMLTSSPAGIPALPRPPKLNVGAPLKPVAAPTDQQLAEALQALRAPRPPVAIK